MIKKRNLCYVRNIFDPEWHCKIDQGMAGLSGAHFSQDSNYVVTSSEFNVRLTIWSMMDPKAKPLYIMNPKFADKGIDFKDNMMLVVQQ